MTMSPLRRTISSSVSHHGQHMDHASSILNNQTNSNGAVSYKQYIIASHVSGGGGGGGAHMIAHSPVGQIISISQPATPYTPIGSVYNTKFPKEQIKNVIKHLAMQKLKKIESEVNLFLPFIALTTLHTLLKGLS
jgi:hypothetical protein